MVHPSIRLLDRRREEFDRLLMRLVAERRMPVFGIGCGMQLLNISQGGNLFLHIPEDLPRALPHLDATDPNHRHALVVEMGSIMERVFGEGEIRVNSMHHMAMDEVAPGFAVTARCPDGVVEAIESTMDDWFAMGTQFHPESDSASALDLRIFEEFVAGVTNPQPIDAAWSPDDRPLERGPRLVLLARHGSRGRPHFGPGTTSTDVRRVGRWLGPLFHFFKQLNPAHFRYHRCITRPAGYFSPDASS